MAMKIFVSVGTHPQPFDRLLKELDRLVAARAIAAEVFAQIGSSYAPSNFPFKKFMDEEEYDKSFERADAVISHGGAGTIINALRHGKKLIVVPRLQKFAEHTNDHQIDLAKALEAEGKCLAVYDIAELGKKINELKNFRPRAASTRERLVERIKVFLRGD